MIIFLGREFKELPDIGLFIYLILIELLFAMDAIDSFIAYFIYLFGVWKRYIFILEEQVFDDGLRLAGGTLLTTSELLT